MSLSKHNDYFIFKIDARLPITCGNLKLIATTHTVLAYNLGHINKDHILDLLKDMKYIYLPSQNV